MERYFIKYAGKMTGLNFKTKEQAEDFCMIGFESKLDALLSWAKGSHLEKQYLRDLDDYFKHDIVKGRIEWVE